MPLALVRAFGGPVDEVLHVAVGLHKAAVEADSGVRLDGKHH